MKLYLKTWNQLYTHTNILWANRIELQTIAVAFLTNLGGTYTALNSQQKSSRIMDNDVWNAVIDMRKLPAKYPQHKPVEMWNAVFEHCSDGPDDKEPIEVIGYGMEYDKVVFKHLLDFRLFIPPDFFKRRICYRDMEHEEWEVAHMIPDEVYASLESPFGQTIEKGEQPYSLAQKKLMLQSHEDYPALKHTSNILADIHSLEKMDLLFNSLKEQYAY